MSEIGGQFLSRALADAVATEMLPHYAFKRTLAADPRAPPVAAAAAAAAAATPVPEDVSMTGPPPPASSSSSSGGPKQQRDQAYTTGGGRWRVQRRDVSHVTPSFHQASVMEVVDDMKRAVCVVDEIGFDPA